VTKHPKNFDRKNGKVMIGFNVKAIDDDALLHEKTTEVESFNYKGMPLSKPLLILLMIFWQVGSYHLIARRELAE
jgi:hypothetical protein